MNVSRTRDILGLTALVALCFALRLAILGTIAAFWRSSRGAAILLVPYLAWIGFATVLNHAIWRLN